VQASEDGVPSVFPRQGHYAQDPDVLANCPPADVSVDRIGALLDYDLPALLGAAGAAASVHQGR